MECVKTNELDYIINIVATPIGNLSDITYRAVETLKSSDIVFAEDTRNSRILFNHYEISTKLSSYHDHNENETSDYIVQQIKSGKSISLISDAGMPLINDPGFTLVKKCIENKIGINVIPGATAFTNALCASGLNPYPFQFLGFLNSKQSKRKSELNAIKDYPYTTIIYESTHRIIDTLKDIYDILGNRNIVVARELTKKFEEFTRGKVLDIMNSIDKFKGEIVILISPMTKQTINEDDIISKFNEYKESGLTNKEAIKQTANSLNVSKNKVYDLIH